MLDDVQRLLQRQTEGLVLASLPVKTVYRHMFTFVAGTGQAVALMNVMESLSSKTGSEICLAT
jgi:hypothetical protein